MQSSAQKTDKKMAAFNFFGYRKDRILKHRIIIIKVELRPQTCKISSKLAKAN